MFTKPVRPVERVFLHCSANDRPEHANITTIRRWHVARGFSDIGYHYVIDFEGRLLVGRSLERIPAAQQGHNSGSIAICVTGGQDGEKAFTQAQFDTLVRLCREINRAYHGEVSFHGHREVANKDCPAFDYQRILALDAKGQMKAPREDLEASRTFAGGRLAGLGAVLSGLSAWAQDQAGVITELDWISQPLARWMLLVNGEALAGTVMNWLPWVAVGLTVAGLYWILCARVDDHVNEVR